MKRPPQPRPSSTPIDPAFVARVRGDLLRFARLQLGSDDDDGDSGGGAFGQLGLLLLTLLAAGQRLSRRQRG